MGESLTIFVGYLTTAPLIELKNTFANQSGLKSDINFYGEYMQRIRNGKITLNETTQSRTDITLLNKFAMSIFYDFSFHLKEGRTLRKL